MTDGEDTTTPVRQPPPRPETMGGDPACWLDRVCTECGRFIDDPLADRCPLCGTPR